MKPFIKTGFFIFIILFLSIQCTRKTLVGWGNDGDIHVLADTTLWESMKPLLRETFEKVIITPQTETIFSIRKTELKNFQRFKNLIFLATLDSSDDVSELVKANLSADARQKVENNTTYIFMQKEKWARQQLIIFLVSNDIETLTENISANKNYLFKLVDDYWNEINMQRIYYKNEQIELEKHLLNTCGCMVRIPDDYSLFIDKPERSFVMLRRMLPERWLFIHWVETEDPSVISREWCIQKRDELGLEFYKGDVIEQKFVQPESDEVEFLGRRALKLSGLWRNDEKSAGGPFRTYCFYDEIDQRIYMIDYAIFQPRLKDDKRDYIRQSEVIMHTFKTSSEVSVENL